MRLLHRLAIMAALVAAFVFLVPVLASLKASAQAVCLKADVLAEQAKRRWNEVPSAAGVVNGGQARVIVLSSRAGSFTLAILDARGGACVIMTGDGWSQVDIAPEERTP